MTTTTAARHSRRKAWLIEYAMCAFRSWVTADADHRKLRVTMRRIKRQERDECRFQRGRGLYIMSMRWTQRTRRMQRTGAASLTPSKNVVNQK